MTEIGSSSQQKVPLILVVDDDRSMRTLLNLAMEEEGYRVVEVKDGEQCLAEYTRWQPDMVLLDAVMPEMDGFTCCERLRNIPGGARTPILMITVLDDQDSVDQAFAAGATDYITKPIYWAVLSQRVKRLLAASQALVQAEQVKEQLRKQREWGQLFREITQQLCQSINLEQFLSSTVADIQVFAQIERVVLYQQENQLLVESVAPGYPSVKDLSRKDLGLETECAAQYQQGQVVAIDDLSQAGLSEQALAQLTQINTRALMMVPIIIQGQFWGLLCVHQCKNPHPWDSWEVEQFSHLGNLLAIAIHLREVKVVSNLSRGLRKIVKTHRPLPENGLRSRVVD